jgi:hypothetical protein
LPKKPIVLLAVVVVATLAFGVGLLFFHQSLKTKALRFSDWVLVVIAAFTAAFWMELIITPQSWQCTNQDIVKQLKTFNSSIEIIGNSRE